MKNVTYRWNTFQLYDYRGVEEHLSAMAAKGWRLEKASGSLWKYRRAEPASLRYAVTYNAGASRFEPGPTEGEQSLEDPAAVPLETDEALRLENIHRCMRKSFLPGNIAVLLLMLFIGRDFFLALVTWDLYGMLKNNALLTAGVLCLAEAALQLWLLAG